jgi:hypothetical protein
MTWRAFNRILLSLLLLVSQQMAFAHALTHWGARASAAHAARPARQDMPGKPVLGERACEQCLAFAQIGSAVRQEPRAFTPARHSTRAQRPQFHSRTRAGTQRLFLPRGPPALILA